MIDTPAAGNIGYGGHRVVVRADSAVPDRQ
jgi:hypothetical protein